MGANSSKQESTIPKIRAAAAGPTSHTERSNTAVVAATSPTAPTVATTDAPPHLLQNNVSDVASPEINLLQLSTSVLTALEVIQEPSPSDTANGELPQALEITAAPTQEETQPSPVVSFKKRGEVTPFAFDEDELSSEEEEENVESDAESDEDALTSNETSSLPRHVTGSININTPSRSPLLPASIGSIPKADEIPNEWKRPDKRLPLQQKILSPSKTDDDSFAVSTRTVSSSLATSLSSSSMFRKGAESFQEGSDIFPESSRANQNDNEEKKVISQPSSPKLFTPVGSAPGDKKPTKSQSSSTLAKRRNVEAPKPVGREPVIRQEDDRLFFQLEL